MIRIEEDTDWLLLTHRDHAALAGEFARHWKNDDFSPPDPFAHILDAVSRHDDSWDAPDREPNLTPEGRPSAFSHELVGTYDAFEEIDLAPYLQVRGQATEQAAGRDPYSAILISMHTENLLTDQADLSGLSAADRELHARFIDGQRARQSELRAQLAARSDLRAHLDDASLRRAFEFLQACDSFSLLVGVDFPEPSKLRHRHPRRSGEPLEIQFLPQGNDHYQLDPWPMDEPEIEFQVPYRRVPKSSCGSLDAFRRAYSACDTVMRRITITRDSIL